MRRLTRYTLSCLLLFAAFNAVEAQTDYGNLLGLQQGWTASYAPQGTSVMMGSIDPAVRRWYVPQELYPEYRWRQWEYTNYARESFSRPVSTDLAGEYFYDLYGNRVSQGWLIFNSGQNSSQDFGNLLYKSSRFRSWFAEVLVSGDHKGQYHYGLTVSSNLRTTFTPMSFSKPRLDGIQFDLATDKHEASLVYARFTGPRGTQGTEISQTNNTTLSAGRIATQIGDFVKVGAHAINSHQSNTRSSQLVENQLRGGLTTGQNQTITQLQVVLRDDSPGDGVGGAAYFPSGSDVVITYRDGTVDRGSDLRFLPLVEGGVAERGYITANGNEEIRLTYDFNAPNFVNRAKGDIAEITGVEFQLVVANDYQVWMTSDRQTDRNGNPVLLMVAQAEGNIQDISNLRTISFDYGLPTATSILGWTFNLSELWGMDVYAEYNMSWGFRKYPNRQEESHEATSGIRGKTKAPAWMVNASKRAGRFFFFGEAYAMDPFYSTQSFVTQADGFIDYSNDVNKVELVEDNDDQDRIPDTYRADWGSPDLQVFPGWDANNDFLPDLNQNDNRVKMNSTPDYEEPFLRYSVDRPEFMFGMDMNNNFWVDQYENDDQPDYPYRKDHKGYNVYGGAELMPGLRLMVGSLREELISSDQRNASDYVLLTYDTSRPKLGTVRFFQMLKRVEDDIPNHLLQWAPDNTIRGGSLTRLVDPLLGRNTFVNQTYLGHRIERGALNVISKANYVLYSQRSDRETRALYNLKKSDHFFGLINKMNYVYDLGRLRIEPRWKSEYRNQSRDLFTDQANESLTEIFSGIVQFPLLKVTTLQAGVEYVLFKDFLDDTRDFDSLLGAVQFNNTSAYQGYVIKALVGLSVERKEIAGADASTGTQAFITIYAGLE